jgi:hypothetical protein
MIRGGVVRLATHTDDEQSGVGADSYVMSYIWEMFQFPLRRCEHLDYAASGGRMIREWWIGKDLEGHGRLVIVR